MPWGISQLWLRALLRLLPATFRALRSRGVPGPIRTLPQDQQGRMASAAVCLSLGPGGVILSLPITH